MKDDFEEEHFQIYNIIDRLRDECIRKYGCIGRAAKAYGSRNLNKYLSSNAYSLGFKLLTKLCKFLNISYQYALIGGERENFKEQTITLNNFYRIYKDIYQGEVDHQVYTCYWLVKTGKVKTFPLKYLIKLSKKSKKTVDFLIGG